MDKTVRALEDLSATDRQLQDNAVLTDAFAHALAQRRAALRDAIPDTFLATYDDLGRRGRHPVVVPVRNSHCGGCYLRLPPQLDSVIRHRHSLRACPHCRRLLYSPPPEDGDNAEERKPELERCIPLEGPSSKRARRNLRVRPAPERRSSAARQKKRHRV